MNLLYLGHTTPKSEQGHPLVSHLMRGPSACPVASLTMKQALLFSSTVHGGGKRRSGISPVLVRLATHRWSGRILDLIQQSCRPGQ